LRIATGWTQPFDNPIPLPRGRKLVVLKDAANYIQKLPKAVAGGQMRPRQHDLLFGKSEAHYSGHLSSNQVRVVQGLSVPPALVASADKVIE
jgi:hypothetical protein